MTISQKLRPRPNDKIRMTIMAHRHRLGIMFTRRERRIVRPLPAVVGKRQMKSDVIRLFTVQWVTNSIWFLRCRFGDKSSIQISQCNTLAAIIIYDYTN